MKFTVIWTPAAQNLLANVWLSAVDRNAVTAASYRIDQRLSVDPIHEGESRDGADRIAFEPPLRIMFRIVLDDARVEVVSVGSMGR